MPNWEHLGACSLYHEEIKDFHNSNSAAGVLLGEFGGTLTTTEVEESILSVISPIFYLISL